LVNFDVPPTPEDYVHRLGRGGRMATTGDAFTLMSPTDQEAVGAIERFMGRAVPRVLLPDFDYKMRPTEIKKVVSWDDGTARPAERAAAPVISARRPVPAPTRPAPAVRRSPAGRAKKPKPTRPSRARA
jgi:ATP-dependent RNA helicase RhlE